MNKTLIVPSSLNDIPLQQMLEYQQLNPELDDHEKSIQAVSIFCNISVKEVTQIPYEVLSRTVDLIKKALNEKPKFEPKFELNGVKYGFVPNLDELSTGSFVDIENYYKNNELYRVLSVLYRPITIEGQKGRYDIEPYKGKINEEFRLIPSGIAYGAMVFFWTLGIDLLNCTLKFLEENPKVQAMSTVSVTNGDGLVLSTGYVMEILQELTLLRNTPFTKPSFGVVTKPIWQNLRKKQSKKHITDEQ